MVRSIKRLLIGVCGVFLLNGSALSYEQIADSATVSQFIANQSGIVAIRDGRGLEIFMLPSMASHRVSDEPNAAGVYNPRISPDGKYVVVNAYYHGTNAQTDQHMIVRGIRPDNLSERYDLGIGYNPQWWIDPESGDLWIVYGSQDEQVSTTAYAGNTYRRKLVDLMPEGEPEFLLDQAFKAGLSKDGKWLGTANKTPMLYNRDSDSVHILTSGSTCYQVMNPTAEPSRMDQILYFNSGHDSIIVKNSSDEVAWAVRKDELEGLPAGYTFKKFHVGGWSNHEEYILTGLQLHEGGYDLLLIKKSDKSCLLLCEGHQHDMWLDGAPEYTSVTRRALSIQPKSHSSKSITRLLTGFTRMPEQETNARYNVLGERIDTQGETSTILLQVNRTN